MIALRKLIDQGLTVKARGNKIIVAPSCKLNEELRDYIRTHKLKLVRELTTGYSSTNYTSTKPFKIYSVIVDGKAIIALSREALTPFTEVMKQKFGTRLAQITQRHSPLRCSPQTD